jgi:hypothetical protein
MIGWLPMHVRHLIGSLDNGGAERFLVRLIAGIAEREPTWRQSVWTLTRNAPLAPGLQRMGAEVRTFDGAKSLRGLAGLARCHGPWPVNRAPCCSAGCTTQR